MADPASKSRAGRAGLRLVVFGVGGQLGREVVENLESSGWAIDELVGVGSSASFGHEFEFRGEALDVLTEAPVLKSRDLVLVCTPRGPALEIVRDALRAEVPCIDCSGALATQAAVPLARRDGEGLASAPLVTIPSSTTLAWRPVLEALAAGAGLARVSGTVLASAAAWGREGVASLSEESIALFNQSETPPVGPAGRATAFDVVPGGALDVPRIRGELARLFGAELPLAIASLQVPTFVGEGTSLSVELERPLDPGAVEALLAARDELSLAVGDEGDETAARAPSLRDALGAPTVLVGPVEADGSGRAGHAYRLWLASDPLRLVADAAIRAAGRRLGIE